MKTRNANIPKNHGCGGCPFSDEEEGIKGCYAEYFLNPADIPLPRQFERKNEFGRSLFPKEPPEWCELKKGPIRVMLSDKNALPY